MEKNEKIKLIVLVDDSRGDIEVSGVNTYKEKVPRNFDAEDVKYAVEKILSSINFENEDIYSPEDEIESDIESIIAENKEYDKDFSDEEFHNGNDEDNNNLDNREFEELIEEDSNSCEDMEIKPEDIIFEHEEKNELISEDIINMKNYRTLEEIKEGINQNVIYKELLANNSEFFNANEALKVLDVQLANVFHSKDLSTHEKLISMQEIVLNRAVLKGKSNSIFVDRLSNIINNLINVTTLEIDKEISKMRERFASISEKELYKGNTELISRLSQERCEQQRKMAENLVKIVKLYDYLTSTVIDSEKSFVEGIPSSNPYINNFIAPAIGIAPKDLAEHVEMLFRALNEGKIKLSAVEVEIRSLLETSAHICELSDSIIAAQSELIETMKAQRIEDVVIVDSLLKNVLRLYAGSDNSGKTASSVVVNEIHCRKGNTLFIDLTRNNKASSYISGMINLYDVFEKPNRGENDLLYCRNLKRTEISKFIEYLQDCTQYYRYINILTDFDQHVKDFQDYALSVNIFLKPEIHSINKAKDFIRAITTDNIAKRLCVVNPSVEPPEMFDILNISPTEYKYVSIPNMPEINKSALRRINPGLNKEVRIIFEEQFQ